MLKTLFILSMVFCHASAKLLSKREELEVLNYHNELRRGEGASNMKEMKWDRVLTKAASAWSDQCVWEHGQPKDIKTNFRTVGQNLYMTTGHLNVTEALKFWFDEKAFYNIHSLTCRSVCGHYTQIVWADSAYLGCAATFCDRHGVTIMVCNYGPGGNVRGRRPYKSGEACSECELGYSCRNDLCYKP